MAKDRNTRRHGLSAPADEAATNDRDALGGTAARPGDAGGKARTARRRQGRVRVPDPDVVAEEANEGEGLSGSGPGRSGSVAGSVGGTTGVAGENAGLSSPGASVPDFPGISPEEYERLRRGRGGQRGSSSGQGDEPSD